MKVQLTSFGQAKFDGGESEDSFGVKAWDETIVAVVADGVGSASGGREAARRIVDSLINNYAARPQTWTPQKALAEFTRLINQSLYHDSMTRFSAPEMASTLAAAVIEGDKLYGVNVGDSRVYLSRTGRLTQLSRDHVAGGRGFEHVLSQAVGIAPDVEPHFFESDLEDGDVAFLCSDGVSNLLSDTELNQKLARRQAARAIVASAGERRTEQTRDDMSAIVIDIAETGKLKAVDELPLEIPEHLHKGDVIDGYRLIQSFQHSDRVWLAAQGAQRFILKFAPREAAESESILHAFTREMWNATRVDGDFFPKAVVPKNVRLRYYVMNFIDAPPLSSALRQGPLKVEEALVLGKFLLQASLHLLRFDLVHGDVKPDNVLVITKDDARQFKLVDLGSATEIFSVTSRAGTASYLAPERFHGAPISEGTEIFAIGVTLFQALTNVLPYGEIERFQTPHFSTPRPPTALNRNIPAWLENLLLRAISADPQTRYRNFSEMLFDLEHPEKVEPFFHSASASNPALRFYRAGFFLLLTALLVLLLLHFLHF